MRRLILWSRNKNNNNLCQEVQEDTEVQDISEEVTTTEVHFKEEEDSTDLIGLQDPQHLDQLLHLTKMRK